MPDWPLFLSLMLATGLWWLHWLPLVFICDLQNLCWLSNIDLALLCLTKLAHAQPASGLVMSWVTMPCAAAQVERELLGTTTSEMQCLILQLLLGLVQSRRGDSCCQAVTVAQLMSFSPTGPKDEMLLWMSLLSPHCNRRPWP